MDEREYARIMVEKRRKKSAVIKNRRKKQIRILKLRIMLSLILICVCAVTTVIAANYIKKTKGEEVLAANNVPEMIAEQTTEEPETGMQLSDDFQKVTTDDVNSAYLAMYDMDNKMVVAGKDYDTKMYPASMTKVMTLIVAVENITDYSKTFSLSYEQFEKLYVQDASTAMFEVGEPVNALDLLYGLILPSGADAALGLADIVAGSEEEFVKLMNLKCAELGLKNTHFTNTTGLHDDDQYTTPYEMCKIMECAMNNELCAKVLNTRTYTTSVTDKHPDGLMLTGHAYLKLDSKKKDDISIIGAKTGYTDAAGYCLVTCAKKNEKKYIVVSGKAESAEFYVLDAYKMYEEYAS